jgi:hypothetical protein
MTVEKMLQEYAKLHLQLISCQEALVAAQAQVAQLQEQQKAQPAQS